MSAAAVMSTSVMRPNPSIVDQFLVDAKDDFVSPTTSVFFNRVGIYRQHVQLLYDNLDFDLEGLQKFRKSVKALNESGLAWHESERELVSSLDTLANLNAANSLIQDFDPEISTAWVKFSVIFNDLSKLTKSLVQSVRNNLLFPVDNLLKTDLKDKGELKKPVDKALRDFDAKVARLEKELKHSSREGTNGRICLSSADLAESVLKERTVLEFELCKFFHGVSKIQSKKGSELLQHLIAFYHAQESFYQEGLRTVEQLHHYVETLIEQLNDINRKQEEERKQLRALSELFEKSPCIKEMNEKASYKQSSQTMAHSSDFPFGSFNKHYPVSASTNGHYRLSLQSQKSISNEVTFGGYLYKKSNRKMHRHWLKRKCEAKNGRFYIWHSKENQPPQEISLLTCQVVAHKEEPKEFHIISYERKYHFQAEDEAAARQWMKVLKKNQDAIQNKTFHSDYGSDTAEVHGVRNDRSVALDSVHNSYDMQKSIVERIKALPGNDRCCDCDSHKDVTWISTNLGSLHCIECSGGHRDLGCHVSRIQSLTLDNWDKASVLVPLSIGNKALNEIYEAAPSAAKEKLSKSSSGNLRKSYITKKYSEKRYLSKIDNGDSLKSYFSYAVASGNLKKTLHALALGVDVNAVLQQENSSEDSQETALFVAIRHDTGGSHLPCIQLLVQNGANVNKTNFDGDSPMHVCIRLNKPECLKLLLLSRNADLKSLRMSLVDLTQQLERSSCADVLSKAIENDRSALADVELPSSLLPTTSPRRPAYVDSDDESMTSSTLSVTGNSPRLPTQNMSPLSHPPVPPPVSSKPRIPSLHGNDYRSTGAHKRSASDSVSGCANATMPGARMVLPPLPPSAAASYPRRGKPTVDGDKRAILDAEAEKAGFRESEEPGAAVETAASGSIEELPPKPAPRKQLRNGVGAKLLKKCRALYDCQADQPDELAFVANDVIIVTRDDLPNEDNNWMEGYVETDPSKLGVFPLTFVTFEV